MILFWFLLYKLPVALQAFSCDLNMPQGLPFEKIWVEILLRPLTQY